jgi:hypothetical protein
MLSIVGHFDVVEQTIMAIFTCLAVFKACAFGFHHMEKDSAAAFS